MSGERESMLRGLAGLDGSNTAVAGRAKWRRRLGHTVVMMLEVQRDSMAGYN